jgi:hypothetical protein
MEANKEKKGNGKKVNLANLQEVVERLRESY